MCVCARALAGACGGGLCRRNCVKEAGLYEGGSI